eukprot:scaffold1708_cov117-Isochrysis_galbana.AAC.2
MACAEGDARAPRYHSHQRRNWRRRWPYPPVDRLRAATQGCPLRTSRLRLPWSARGRRTAPMIGANFYFSSSSSIHNVLVDASAVNEMFATVHAAGSSLLGLFTSCATFDSTGGRQRVQKIKAQ